MQCNARAQYMLTHLDCARNIFLHSNRSHVCSYALRVVGFSKPCTHQWGHGLKRCSSNRVVCIAARVTKQYFGEDYDLTREWGMTNLLGVCVTYGTKAQYGALWHRASQSWIRNWEKDAWFWVSWYDVFAFWFLQCAASGAVGLDGVATQTMAEDALAKQWVEAKQVVLGSQRCSGQYAKPCTVGSAEIMSACVGWLIESLCTSTLRPRTCWQMHIVHHTCIQFEMRILPILIK